MDKRQCDGCGKDLAANEPVDISTNPHAPSSVLCGDCAKVADQ